VPQLVKGGKYVFGWSKVSESGMIVIPPEAVDEYSFRDGDKVFIMSGSRTSGGFGIYLPALLKSTSLSSVLPPELERFQTPRGEIIKRSKWALCWTVMEKCGCIVLPLEPLKAYGTVPGALLLSVRGSYVALSFLVRGPIIEEALQHPELVRL